MSEKRCGYIHYITLPILWFFALYLICHQLSIIVNYTAIYSSRLKITGHNLHYEHKTEKDTARDNDDVEKTESTESIDRPHTLMSELHLNKYRLWAVDKQRQRLKTELQEFQFFGRENENLDDFVIEKGGQPIRSMVISTFRSGSNFLGQILQQHPGTYYHWEPFLHFGSIQIRSKKLAEESIRIAQDLFNCRYDNLTDYINSSKSKSWIHSPNSRLWRYCRPKDQVCWDPNFLSSICKLFPYQIMKTVRMRLRIAKTLLDDKRLNLKVLLLIRDPRGTMQSRSHRDWCSNPDCSDPINLCSDMVDDFYEAKLLYRQYPTRFMALRYEDISMSPNSDTKKIYQFFGLQYSEQIESFVHKHTTQDDLNKNPYSTYKNSKVAPFHWKMDLAHNFSKVEEIQTSCSKAMNLWGYVPVVKAENLPSFESVTEPPWEEMKISPDNDNLK